jgi:hypothetical protein
MSRMFASLRESHIFAKIPQLFNGGFQSYLRNPPTH